VEPPYECEKTRDAEQGDQMGEWQFLRVEGEVIAIASCGEGKGDVFCP